MMNDVKLNNINNANMVKAGDMINVQGHKGLILEVSKTVRDGVPCTYFMVEFNDDLKNTSYNGGWFGSSDEYFSYKVN